MSKYAEILMLDEKKLAAEQVQDRVAAAQLEVGNAKLQASRSMSAAKAKEKAALRSNSFNPEQIIAARREIKALEQDLSELTALEKELF